MKKQDIDMLNKIAASAQDAAVPESLKPEQIEQRLKGRRQKKRKFYKAACAAACLCLCFGAGGAAYIRNNADNAAYVKEDSAVPNDDAAVKQEDSNRKADKADAAQMAQAESAAKEEEAPLKKIGRMYTLASDYGEVFDSLKKSTQHERKMAEKMVFAEDSTGARGDIVKEELVNSPADALSSADAVKDSADDYSTTNLQVEGVDESDIVKTDGRYIYVVQDAKVQVIDVRNKLPETAGTIVPDMDEDTDSIREMYVSGGMLTLILQTEKTSMIQTSETETEIKIEDSQSMGPDTEQSVPGDTGARKKLAATDDAAYNINTSAVTKALTYDITEPEKAVLLDTAVQDGWYSTSRKTGSRLYLFTDQSMHLNSGLKRGSAICDDGLSGWIPCVNQKAVAADCIYLPEQGTGTQGLLMSSIDLADHSRVLDTKLLVNNYAQLYVSRDSVYLYYTDYVNSVEKTRIARFALDADGTIRAKAASTLKGSIRDTFAIHERDGYLQALTSVTSADPWENRVYVLDENMEVIGKLTGLAKGEQIYSARFVGTTGYFVTYRNTDPLFTVDFSNPREPKVIGELQVTGFSEYLHFWSDGKLLGIGYETNPDDGMQIGVKLSMFDISDPSKVTEEAKLVLEGVDGCEGMYDYKAILVNQKKNIIALTTETYGREYQENYRVFAYEGGKFVSRLERSLKGADGYYDNSVHNRRSLYVGDILYLVNAKKTAAFDMKDGFKKIGGVKYAE